uniref:Suv3 N-terminal domain-containing protein n=1 Tax=Timema poppense TaxID=170557 RepID=A0A7R9DAH7_TIMPO|nr:unnamed protein product [Timema poppensis]
MSRSYYLLHQAYVSFRRYCLEADALPVDLHVVISDILQGAGHIDDIFPYFLRHSKHIFPHLECMDDLKKISDLRTPANWCLCGMTSLLHFQDHYTTPLFQFTLMQAIRKLILAVQRTELQAES